MKCLKKLLILVGIVVLTVLILHSILQPIIEDYVKELIRSISCVTPSVID